jgi:hypothetical protein
VKGADEDRPRVRLLFPDGCTMTADDAVSVLLLWGAVQWTPVTDLAEVKVELARRAGALRGADVDPSLPADVFLEALDEAALVAVLHVPAKSKPGVLDAPWRERHDPEG